MPLLPHQQAAVDEMRELSEEKQKDRRHNDRLQYLARMILTVQGFQQTDPDALLDYESHPDSRARAAFRLAELSYEFWQENHE